MKPNASNILYPCNKPKMVMSKTFCVYWDTKYSELFYIQIKIYNLIFNLTSMPTDYMVQ